MAPDSKLQAKHTFGRRVAYAVGIGERRAGLAQGAKVRHAFAVLANAEVSHPAAKAFQGKENHILLLVERQLPEFFHQGILIFNWMVERVFRFRVPAQHRDSLLKALRADAVFALVDVLVQDCQVRGLDSLPADAAGLVVVVRIPARDGNYHKDARKHAGHPQGKRTLAQLCKHHEKQCTRKQHQEHGQQEVREPVERNVRRHRRIQAEDRIRGKEGHGQVLPHPAHDLVVDGAYDQMEPGERGHQHAHPSCGLSLQKRSQGE